MLILLGSFLALMILGLPVALAMAVSSLLYILVTGMAPDVVLAQRMIAGVESFPLLAVPFFILAGNLMNIAGVTGRIYSFAVALVGWMRGRARPGQHHGLGDLLRHVGHRARRCRRARHDRDQGDEGPRLFDRVRRGRDRGFRHPRADHPALLAVRDLRHDGERLDRRPLPGRPHPGAVHDAADDGDGGLLRAPERLGQRHPVFLDAARGSHARGSDRPRLPGGGLADDAGRAVDEPRDRPRAGHPPGARLVVRLLGRHGPDGAGHPDRRHDHGAVHAHRGGRRGGALVAVPRPRALPLDDLEDAGQGHLRHHRDHRLGPVHRHRGLDLRLASHRQPGGPAPVRLHPRR